MFLFEKACAQLTPHIPFGSWLELAPCRLSPWQQAGPAAVFLQQPPGPLGVQPLARGLDSPPQRPLCWHSPVRKESTFFQGQGPGLAKESELPVGRGLAPRHREPMWTLDSNKGPLDLSLDVHPELCEGR